MPTATRALDQTCLAQKRAETAGTIIEHGHQGSQGLEAGDQIEDHQDQENKMRRRTMPTNGPQEPGIDAFDDEGPIDHCQAQQRDCGDGSHQEQGGVIHRQDGTEQPG